MVGGTCLGDLIRELKCVQVSTRGFFGLERFLFTFASSLR